MAHDGYSVILHKNRFGFAAFQFCKEDDTYVYLMIEILYIMVQISLMPFALFCENWDLSKDPNSLSNNS